MVSFKLSHQSSRSLSYQQFLAGGVWVVAACGLRFAMVRAVLLMRCVLLGLQAHLYDREDAIDGIFQGSSPSSSVTAGAGYTDGEDGDGVRMSLVDDEKLVDDHTVDGLTEEGWTVCSHGMAAEGDMSVGMASEGDVSVVSDATGDQHDIVPTGVIGAEYHALQTEADEAKRADASPHGTQQVSRTACSRKPSLHEFTNIRKLNIRETEQTLNVMCVGESGMGKSTLVDAFFKTFRQQDEVDRLVGEESWRVQEKKQSLTRQENMLREAEKEMTRLKDEAAVGVGVATAAVSAVAVVAAAVLVAGTVAVVVIE